MVKNEIKVGTEVLVDERVWGVVVEVYGNMVIVMDEDGEDHDGIHLQRLTVLDFSPIQDAKDWVIDCAVDSEDQELREEWAKEASPKQVRRYVDRHMDGGWHENLCISFGYHSQFPGNEWMQKLYKLG
jgi:hypothetical protein